MNARPKDSLLHAVYKFDTTLKHFQAYIIYISNVFSLPYYADFLHQVSLNVYDPTCIKHTFDDNNFKQDINNLLSRIEPRSISG